MSVQGAVADRLGDHAEAMQFYRDALKIAPANQSDATQHGAFLCARQAIARGREGPQQAAASPKADARTRGDLALVLALEGKFSEAEQVGLTDLSPEAARANVEAVRQMIAQNISWRQLRAPKAGKSKPPQDAG